MNMDPLYPEDAVAAGLITGAKQKHDAMQDIHHVIYPDSFGQDEASSSKKGLQALDLQSAGAQTVVTSPASVGTGQSASADAASDSTSSSIVPAQTPFLLQSAAEKAALLGQLTVNVPGRQPAEMITPCNPLRPFYPGVAQMCRMTPSTSEAAAEFLMHSGYAMISVSAYAHMVEQEARSAAKKAASSQPDGTKPEAKPAVAVIYIEGQSTKCLAQHLIQLPCLYSNAQLHQQQMACLGVCLAAPPLHYLATLSC